MMRRITLLAALFASTVLCGCTGLSKSIIGPDSLFDLGAGARLADVKRKLGVPQHQFTARDSGAEVLCVSYTVRKPYQTYYLVFRDGELEKIMECPPLDSEEVQREWGTGSTLKPVDADERLMTVLKAEAPAVESLRETMQARCRIKSSGSNVWPAFILTAPLLPVALFTAPEWGHLALQRRFDPQKIRLGMTVADVDEAFGGAYGEVKLEAEAGASEEQVRVYGEVATHHMSEWFPWIVVYFADGKVSRFFSGHFVDLRIVAAAAPPEAAGPDELNKGE